MNRRANIGIDRRIDLEWLDFAAAEAAAGVSVGEMRSRVWDLLDGVVSGEAFNSARGKTVTVLNHIWGDVPPSAKALREHAASNFRDCRADERLGLHWAMMVGTYPLFSDVAAAIGRLLALQGGFTLAHLTRRLVGTWGERSTLTRATQRIVRSMIQWGVLADAEVRGTYVGVRRKRMIGPVVGIVLIEALLVDAEAAAIPLEQLIGHAALFPFEIQVNVGHVRGASQFRVHRQGLDDDFVELAKGADRGLRNVGMASEAVT